MHGLWIVMEILVKLPGLASWLLSLTTLYNSSDAIVFDSVDQKVTVLGSFEATLIKKIIISEDGRINLLKG